MLLCVCADISSGTVYCAHLPYRGGGRVERVAGRGFPSVRLVNTVSLLRKRRCAQGRARVLTGHGSGGLLLLVCCARRRRAACPPWAPAATVLLLAAGAMALRLAGTARLGAGLLFISWLTLSLFSLAHPLDGQQQTGRSPRGIVYAVSLSISIALSSGDHSSACTALPLFSSCLLFCDISWFYILARASPFVQVSHVYPLKTFLAVFLLYITLFTFAENNMAVSLCILPLY